MGVTGTAVLLAALVVSAQTVGGPRGQTKVYVAEEQSGTVSALEPRRPPHFGYRRTVLPMGGKPHALRASPDGRWIWATVTETGELWLIDTGADRVVAQIAVGSRPAHVALDPDGRTRFPGHS